MRLNADFNERALVRFDDNPWVPSPMPGVERKMLDRIGEEVARATTIVRFAPGSAFSAHIHDGGEEFVVLEGVFQDEHGDFPAGCYVRNPPTSRHTPASEPGTVILVKLHQFDPADRTHVRTDTTRARPVAEAGRAGIGVLPLFHDDHEDVRVETWAAGANVSLDATRGMELFVLDGELSESGEALGRWDWLRVPPGGRVDAVAGKDGARVWIKAGHLSEVRGGA